MAATTVNSGDVEVVNLAPVAMHACAWSAVSCRPPVPGSAALRPQPGHLLPDFLGRAGKHDRGKQHGWANDGEVVVNFGFQNSSDEKLKRAVEPAGPEELQQVFGQPEVHVGLRRPKRARGPTRAASIRG